MSWTGIVHPPIAVISVGINACKDKGNPRITVNFNKAMVYNLGLVIGGRADIEVGNDEHAGMMRIIFGKAGGTARVISGGGLGAGKMGCRVSARVWPGLKDFAPRVKLTEFHWDASSNTLTFNIPSSMLVNPVYQNSLAVTCGGSNA